MSSVREFLSASNPTNLQLKGPFSFTFKQIFLSFLKDPRDTIPKLNKKTKKTKKNSKLLPTICLGCTLPHLTLLVASYLIALAHASPIAYFDISLMEIDRSRASGVSEIFCFSFAPRLFLPKLFPSNYYTSRQIRK